MATVYHDTTKINSANFAQGGEAMNTIKEWLERRSEKYTEIGLNFVKKHPDIFGEYTIPIVCSVVGVWEAFPVLFLIALL